MKILLYSLIYIKIVEERVKREKGVREIDRETERVREREREREREKKKERERRKSAVQKY